MFRVCDSCFVTRVLCSCLSWGATQVMSIGEVSLRVVSLVWATVVMGFWGAVAFLSIEFVGMCALMLVTNQEDERNVLRGLQLALSTVPAVHWHEEMAAWGVVAQVVWRGCSQLVFAAMPAIKSGVCGDDEKPADTGCLPGTWLAMMLIVWCVVFAGLLPYFLWFVVYRHKQVMAAMVVVDGSRLRHHHVRRRLRLFGGGSNKRGGGGRHDDSSGSGSGDEIPVVVMHNPYKRQLGNIER